MTTAKKIKEFGAKVKRTDFGYIYIGVNFTIEFSRETYDHGKFWTIDLYGDTVTQEMYDYWVGNQCYDTKDDLCWHLLMTDKGISTDKAKKSVVPHYVVFTQKSSPKFPEHAVKCTSFTRGQEYMKYLSTSGIDWLNWKLVSQSEFDVITQQHPIVGENTFIDRFENA